MTTPGPETIELRPASGAPVPMPAAVAPSATALAGARAAKITPEAVARMVAAEERAANAAIEDPLAEFVGAFDFGPADLAKRYHDYLAADPRRPYEAS